MPHRFSETDIDEVMRMRAEGTSFRAIGKTFGVSADTAIKVVNGTWTPRPLKLPEDDGALYLDWLLLGTYSAVGRKYGATEEPVRRRMKRFRASLAANS